MKMSQRNIVMIAFLALAACFLSIHYFLGPRLQVVQQEKVQLTGEVAAKQARLDAIGELKGPLKKLEVKMADVDSVGLPKGEQLPDLIEQVEQLVLSDKDFKIVNLQPTLTKGKAGESSAAVESQIALTVTGDQEKIGGLFDLLHQNVRPIYVKTVTMAPVKATAGAPPNAVDVTIGLVAYSASAIATSDAIGATPGGQP